MGKHGPCRHCGITSTPLWRNGPPEKPVLCNACGSRWRTKGSLANYTPLHAREPIEWEEPKITKMKSISLKMEEQRPQKRKYMNGIVENSCKVFYCESDQNYIKVFEGDASNRSSSGSAISYSESCVNLGAIDASDCTGSAQSNAQESIQLVPSKKRTIIKLRPSPVEKLTKDLYSIWHEQQSSNLSGSSEEELLLEGEMPMGSYEIGHGGLLLRYPSSKAVEEESEASSAPCDKKFRMPLSRMADNENTGWFQKLTVNALQELPGRFTPENFDLLKNKDSILRSIDLKEVIGFEVFMEHLTNEEQLRLMKYLPSVDTDKPFESIRSMFSSPQFAENLSDFMQLLEDGIFDLSSSRMNVEDCRRLKRLVLVNFEKARWVQRYEVLKGIKRENEIGISGTNFLRRSNLASIKRLHEIQNQQLQEFTDVVENPRRVCRSNNAKLSFSKSSAPNTNGSLQTKTPTAEGVLDSKTSCFDPSSLFASPLDRNPLLQFVDEDSEQDLLLDVRCGAAFPEAELLCGRHGWNRKSASNSSLGESSTIVEEDSLCNFQLPV